MVQRVWRIAGLAPTTGYGTIVLAAVVATDQALGTTLTSVDFDDAQSVRNAVEALLAARQRVWRSRAGAARTWPPDAPRAVG
ncbi:MAG: hypothetical protein JWM12_1023 [Ilumatobacteraceae bacterium]|nr:hypothetical protein [Ilumatobacteraceae bacterium]